MRVQRAVFVFVFGMLAFAPPAALADCPPCGPLYCLNTQGYTTALSKKKALLQNASDKYPQRLIDLYDRVDRCQACVEGGPDGFNLMTVQNNGDKILDGWSADNERIGARQVADKSIKSCYVVLYRQACACCNQPKYDARPDYDATLDLSKSMALPCQSD